MDRIWLPRGAHWDLNISHDRLPTLGPFSIEAGWKLVHHTAESSRDTASIIVGVLRQKKATAHCVYGYNPDTRFPVVIQMAPLNHAVMTLEHNLAEETNRARCIQIEICGRAADSHRWSDNYYKGYANLCRMIERRVPITRRAPKKFEPGVQRFTGKGFVSARGHVGHMHAPGNSHTDPARLDIEKLFHYMKLADNHGLELKPVRR